jgi:hypothetical protein
MVRGNQVWESHRKKTVANAILAVEILLRLAGNFSVKAKLSLPPPVYLMVEECLLLT